MRGKVYSLLSSEVRKAHTDYIDITARYVKIVRDRSYVSSIKETHDIKQTGSREGLKDLELSSCPLLRRGVARGSQR